MQEFWLSSTVTPKKPAYKKGDCYKKFENHLNRELYAKKPNEKWCTDFTYIFMEDGRKRDNCSMIDLFDRSVVATLNSSHMDAKLAVQTRRIALEKTILPKTCCCTVTRVHRTPRGHLPITVKKRNTAGHE